MRKINNKKLKTFAIPQISPKGWLKRQLQIQMDGLTGCLYEVWDSVGSYSGWLGGTGENWERGPYYLDGLLPLAYYLEDQAHWELACRFVNWTLESQDEQGNFGPLSSKEDYWSRFVMLKVLIQYYEIESDERVLPFFDRYFQFLHHKIPQTPVTQWSRARIGDLLYCLEWYMEREPQEYLFELVDLLREQALDWTDVFSNFPFIRPTAYYYDWEKSQSHYEWEEFDDIMNYHTSHIVNVTMGLKYPAMLSYFYQDKDYQEITLKGIRDTEKYHGVATGAVNGDEHLSGSNPTQGAELCSIVEYMFSLQTMLEAFGNPRFADRLERLAYNALPGTITEDFMAHQYLQQANQIISNRARRNWFNNNEEANMFGLEPHFGCCTANMHQGWPKFVKSLWYQDEEADIVSMVFAPSELSVTAEDKKLVIRLETEYPFKAGLVYRVKEGCHDHTALKIRIPEWCSSFAVYKNGVCLDQCRSIAEADRIYTLADSLHSGDVLEFWPDMAIRKSTWFHNSVAVERGPLVYALDIRESWQTIKEVAGVRDYEVYPDSAWNYALADDGEFEAEERPVGAIPFSKKDCPVVLKGAGRRLSTWTVEDNSAGLLPVSPVEADGEEERLRLIPYGCTKLRITQFPYYGERR